MGLPPGSDAKSKWSSSEIGANPAGRRPGRVTVVRSVTPILQLRPVDYLHLDGRGDFFSQLTNTCVVF